VSAGPKLRAPRDDGAVLEVPPLSSIGPLLAANRRELASHSLRICGRPLAELRGLACREVIQAATTYLADAGEPIPPAGDLPLILAGHQPELFHPGVWIKNFALTGLARRHGLLPVNLVVDNDAAKAPTVQVPMRDDTTGVHLGAVPFDALTGDAPYEERTVHDEALFASFAERAMSLLRPWDFAPMLPAFWDEVLRQAQRTRLLGERLAAARRTIERGWGAHNFELPVSRMCGTEAFACFACHLLSDIARFNEVHNAALRDHRRAHRIRSKNHPVPDLAHAGDWYEAPFWAWRAGQPRRARLFARVHDGGIDLRAGTEEWPTLRLGDPARTVAEWRLLERQGLKVRTRALTTTLFARLVLGDLFIHGIGGGKYDELTDEIIRRYFGITPPGFVILSGTLLLPLPTFDNPALSKKFLHSLLRNIRYKPEKVLFLLQDGWINAWPDDPNPQVEALDAEKQLWINKQPANRPERKERFFALRKLNEQMQPFLADYAAQKQQRLAEVEAQVHANVITQRRDYAFCLFPEAKIRNFCTQFLVTPEATTTGRT
jgi:hypothetical protein